MEVPELSCGHFLSRSHSGWILVWSALWKQTGKWGESTVKIFLLQEPNSRALTKRQIYNLIRNRWKFGYLNTFPIFSKISIQFHKLERTCWTAYSHDQTKTLTYSAKSRVESGKTIRIRAFWSRGFPPFVFGISHAWIALHIRKEEKSRTEGKRAQSSTIDIQDYLGKSFIGFLHAAST